MQDVRTRRISRELFLASAGASLGVLEPWVTDRLTAMLAEEEAAPGERIFKAGDSPDHFYLVREGRLELVRNGKSVETVDGPRVVGMLDALLEEEHTLSAYARTPTQLLRVPSDAWFELLEDSFDLARMLVLSLLRVVAALEERVWANGRPSATPTSLIVEPGGAPVDIIGRVTLLMRTPLLGGAGVRPVSDLASVCEEVAFAADERLFEWGAPRESIFVLIDGDVEARKKGASVRWRGGAGQMVCSTVPFGETGSQWEAHAISPTRALTFRIEDWFDVMEENFEMVRATLAALARERERLVAMP